MGNLRWAGRCTSAAVCSIDNSLLEAILLAVVTVIRRSVSIDDSCHLIIVSERGVSVSKCVSTAASLVSPIPGKTRAAYR